MITPSYQVEGESVGADLTIEVVDRNHAHQNPQPLPAGETMAVALRVEEDPVSGWNLFTDTTGFTWAPQHAGLETVPGEGHAHFHIDEHKVGRVSTGAGPRTAHHHGQPARQQPCSLSGRRRNHRRDGIGRGGR